MTQRILVFQQNGSGEKKIKGIKKFGGDLFRLDIVSIDQPLPPLLEDTGPYLPNSIEADLVLDFLKHPDLSHDLALVCRKLDIPIVASGKKWPMAITPVT
jgi:thymidylate synthase